MAIRFNWIILVLVDRSSFLFRVLCDSDQKRNSRMGTEAQFAFGYATNFSAPRTIEGHVINCVFKPLVTRMTSSLKLLKSSENVVT